MYRLKPIRKARRPQPPKVLLQSANVAFWVMFAVSVALGGGQAIGGVPALASAILPPGIVAAQASSAVHRVGVGLRVVLRDQPASEFAPQVLFPVVARSMPEWMMKRAPTVVASAPELPAAPQGTVPKIAIVIDDLGSDLAHTDRAMALPKEISLSFLPYADATPWLAVSAKRRGHEVLVHEPMQAVGGENPGPMTLRTDLSSNEIRRRFVGALARVPGATGINNHMGSAFTADGNALVPVVEELSARHLFFFDSRTTPHSQVLRVAHAFGVASAGRDVFLDDEQTADGVSAQLAELEAKARRQGVAITIGHPHDVTLAALAAWSARAASRGFTLVPVSEAIRLKTEYAARLVLADTK